MNCCVLGNGPSLSIDAIPPNCDLIGVNRSYEVIYSPIWCTVDYKAWEVAYEKFSQGLRPDRVYLRRTAVRSQPLVFPGTVIYEEFRGNSGMFGIQVAMDLGYERINLIGYDPWVYDNFHGPKEMRSINEIRTTRKADRKKLWKLKDDPRFYRWAPSALAFRPLAETIDWDQAGRSLE